MRDNGEAGRRARARGLLAAMIGAAAGTATGIPLPGQRPTIDPMFGFKRKLNTSREQARRRRQRGLG